MSKQAISNFFSKTVIFFIFIFIAGAPLAAFDFTNSDYRYYVDESIENYRGIIIAHERGGFGWGVFGAINWREIASAMDFMLCVQEGSDVSKYKGNFLRFRKSITNLVNFYGHEELLYAPTVQMGHSQGAFTLATTSALHGVSNVAAMIGYETGIFYTEEFTQDELTNIIKRIPVHIIMGTEDYMSSTPVFSQYPKHQRYRSNHNALYGYSMMKGITHGGNGFFRNTTMSLPFILSVLGQSLPTNTAPYTNDRVLSMLNISNGYLADAGYWTNISISNYEFKYPEFRLLGSMKTWKYTETPPAGVSNEAKSWLPDHATAKVWQAFCDYYTNYIYDPAGTEIADAIQTVALLSKRSHTGEGMDEHAIINVMRSRTNGDLDVYYSVESGAGYAENGTDISNLSGVITIPAGKYQADLNIYTKNDFDVEGDEQVKITLTSNDAYFRHYPFNRAVIITEDETPPTQNALTPTDGETEFSSMGTLSITFDEGVQRGSGNIIISNLTDGGLHEDIDINGAQVSGFESNLVYFSPVATFETNKNYGIYIAEGVIEDMSQNDFAGISSWSFTAKNIVPQNNAAEVIFEDLDYDGSELGGTVEIKKAADENDILYYNIYWGSSPSAKDGFIASLAKNGTDIEFNIPFNTEHKPYILVFSSNLSGESENPVYCSVPDTDSDLMLTYHDGFGCPETEWVEGWENVMEDTGNQGSNDAWYFRYVTVDTNQDYSYNGSPFIRITHYKDFPMFATFKGSNSGGFDDGVERVEFYACAHFNNGSAEYDLNISTDRGSTWSNVTNRIRMSNTWTYYNIYVGVEADRVHVMLSNIGYNPVRFDEFKIFSKIPSVPDEKANSVVFVDNDPDTNEISGNLIINKAADESGISHYRLYWGSDENTILSTDPLIAEIAAMNNAQYYHSFADNTAIPDGAQYLIVRTRKDGEMAEGVSTKINVDGAVLTDKYPNKGAIDFKGTSSLIMTFSEEVYPASGNIYISNMSGDLFESFSVTSSNVKGEGSTEITLDPAGELLPSNSYYVIVPQGTFTNASGGASGTIDSTNEWYFETSMAPGVSSFSTEDDASNKFSSPFAVTFNETVFCVSGSIIISNLSDGTLFEGIDVNSSKVNGNATKIISINPDADMEHGKLYAVYITNGLFQDAAGNDFPGLSSSWSFTAYKTPPIHLARGVSFSDLDYEAGEIGGVVTVSNSVADYDIEYYNVYLGSSSDTKEMFIAAISSDITNPELEIEHDTTYYPYLLIYSSNAGGEMYRPLAFEIEDTSDPSTVFFRDTMEIDWGPQGAWYDYQVYSNMGSNSAWNIYNVRYANLYGNNYLFISPNYRPGGYIEYVGRDNEGVRGGIKEISFKIRKNDGAKLTNLVEISIDGGPWQPRITNAITNYSGSYAWDPPLTNDINITSDKVKFRLSILNDETAIIDDICIHKYSHNLQPTNKAQAGNFLRDDYYYKGTISGDLLITKALDEHDVNYYRIYWGSAPETKLKHDPLIAEYKFSGSDITHSFADNTQAPENAEYIIVRTKNQYGEMGSGINIPIKPAGPHILALSPTNSSKDVDVDSQLSITFNEPVFAAGGTIYVSNLSGEHAAIPSSAFSGLGSSNLSIYPGTLSEEKEYHVVIDEGCFSNAAGESYPLMLANTRWGFASTVRPTLTNVSPSNGAASVSSLAALILNFNDKVFEGSGYLVISNVTDGVPHELIDTGGGQISGFGSSRLTVDPETKLSGGKDYGVYIPSSTFVDDAGNGFNGISTWDFSCVDTAPRRSADGVSFEDKDSRQGFIGGTLVITNATEESSIECYNIYYSSNGIDKGAVLSIVNTIGAPIEIDISYGTEHEQYIMVFASNEYGESSVSNSVEIVDSEKGTFLAYYDGFESGEHHWSEVDTWLDTSGEGSNNAWNMNNSKLKDGKGLGSDANRHSICFDHSATTAVFQGPDGEGISGIVHSVVFNTKTLGSTDVELKVSYDQGITWESCGTNAMDPVGFSSNVYYSNRINVSGNNLWFTISADGDYSYIDDFKIYKSLPSAPTVKAADISFIDNDKTEGEIAGSVIINKATNETDVSMYKLYWGSSWNKKLISSPLIATFNATGIAQYQHLFPTDTEMPDEATHLLVFTRNEYGEMAESISTEIVDDVLAGGAVPKNKSAGLFFTDTDTNAGEISGDVIITKAADESDVTHYALYFSEDGSSPYGSALAVFAADGRQSFTNSIGADTATGSRTHFIVFTTNENGMMSSGKPLLIDDDNSGDIAPIPTHKATGINFSDTDSDSGEIGGNVTITAASDESDVDKYYVFYSSDSTGKAGSAIGSITADGSASYSLAISENTALANSYLIVYTSNNAGMMAEGIYCLISDYYEGPAVPEVAAQGLSFVDTDYEADEIGGDIRVTAASNESNITHYVLYFSDNGTSSTGSALAAIVADDSPSYTYTLANNTAMSTHTHFIVFTSNADGMMASGVSAAINDETGSDTRAPVVSIVSGPSSPIATNETFTVGLETDEERGFWRFAGSAFAAFDSSTNVTIDRTGTLSYFGRDAAGNTSATNSVAYSFDMTAPTMTLDPPTGFITNWMFSVEMSLDGGSGFWSTNDGISWTRFNHPATETLSVSFQTVRLKYYTVDDFDNTSETNTALYQSTSAPIISITNGPKSSIATNETFTLMLDASGDNGYWSTNGSAYTEFGDTDGASILIKEDTTLRYYGFDGFASVSITNELVYTFDYTAPTVSISSGPTSSITTNKAFTVRLNVDEANGYVSIGGAFGKFSGTTNIAIESNATLRYFGEDELGNISETNEIAYTVEYDTTAPNVTITSGPTNSITTNEAFTLTLTSDEESGYWSTNGSAFASFTSNTNLTISGTTTLRYFGRDSSYNSSATNEVVYTVDTTAPSVTISSGPTNSITTNEEFTLTLTSDEENGYFSTDGSNYHSFASNTNLTISDTTTLSYYGEDALDNLSATNEVVYTFDTTAPSLTISSGPTTDLTTNEAFTLTLTSDEESGYFSTDGSNYHSFASNTNLMISNTTTLSYYGADTVGNVSATNEVVYTFDTTAPSVTISSGPTNSITTNEEFTLTLTSDEESGYFSTNGSTFASFTSSTNLMISSTTTLRFYGKDALGNTGSTNEVEYTIEKLLTEDGKAKVSSVIIGQDETVKFLSDEKVDLEVYTISGQLVYKDRVEAGERKEWDAKNSFGDKLAPGVYIVRYVNDKGEAEIFKIIIGR